MRTSEDYQEQAIRCLRLAQSIDYAPNKALLLEMAQQWVKTAEFARQREVMAEDAARSIAIPQPEPMTSQ